MSLAEVALGVSLLSLGLAGVACWRAWRGEKLQRGRIAVLDARISNLYEGGQSVCNLTVKNVGRDSVTVSSAGIEYWLENAASGAPKQIAMIPQSLHLAAGEERLLQEPIKLGVDEMRGIIDQVDAIYVGVRADYIDAIGPQVGAWAFHNMMGRADKFDKLEPLSPMPVFLQRPVYR